jgi:dipeptidyl aminopeptidase/acylaminoacyl peptidase
MRVVALVVAAGVLTARSTAGQSPVAAPRAELPAAAFTIADILSAPFPSSLTAAPNGGAIAWVADSAGVRNIWVATSPSYAAHRVTAYTRDDGQEITDVRWLPNARGLVYTRGDGPNGQGELPNPALLPGGVDQSVWLVSLGAGFRAIDGARRLGGGHAPAVDPNGGRVVFIDKDQLWSTSVDGHAQPTQLLHTRGKLTTLRWSSDGKRLAFVSDRTTHTFVGVYDFTDRTLVYLAPSVDRDALPVWAADGRRVAFVRVPAESRTRVFGPRRAGQPWSIWVADAATGVGRELWTAATGMGSAFHPLEGDLSGVGQGDDPADQLFWGAGDHLVFPWERDGWEHLYDVAAAAQEPTLLTPGNFEVEQAALLPDRKALIVTSNQGELERRRLWRVTVGAAMVTPVTGDASPDIDGDAIQWSPTPFADGTTIALLHSGIRLPPRPALATLGSAPRDVAPELLPSRFPTAALVEPQVVTFPAADGLQLHGELFLPPSQGGDQVQTRHPAVVFFHGGSRRQMLQGWHYMQYYANSYAFNQYLASRGYIVLAVNYRSGVGYGMEFREALDYGATGASEYNDVQGAGLYLRSRADVDATHIGAWGGSYGGYLTALALARSSDLYAAGVDFHGVHDWNLEFDALVPGWDTERDLIARKLAFTSSPMASVETWRSPVLLIQGDDDRSVVFRQTVQLTEDLRARGVHVEQLVFPDEGHEFLTHAHWLEAYDATAGFLDRMLRGGAAAQPAVSRR